MTKYIVSILVFLVLIGGSYWFYINKPDLVQVVKNTVSNQNNDNDNIATDDVNGIGSGEDVDGSGADVQDEVDVSTGRDVTGEEVNEPGTGVSDEQIDEQIEENEIIEELEEVDYGFSYSGELVDVSGGQAAGIAQAGFVDGTYNLLAEFANLSDPEEEFFYEGWVVRNQPLSVISTGRVDKNNGVYKNIFSSIQNLIGHSFYVLTLEPDDDDPAPAEHILEGTMSKL
jgi:hypothetical protein